VAAYRIAQEALTNVVRHAHARHCTIRLALDETAGLLTLEVRDDGRGITPAPKKGVGLTSMRERAEELGGTWIVEQVPAGGTCVLVQLPYLLPMSAGTMDRLPQSLPPEEDN
jgi:signal transduction histidine kinase